MASGPPTPSNPSAPSPARSRTRDFLDKWGAWAIVLIVGLAGIGGVVVGGLYLYVSDHAFGADVTRVECRGPLSSDSNNRVTVQTRFLAIERTVVGIPDVPCSQLREGYYVEHFIRSKRSILYDEQGGECIYDTARGTNC